jgi:hypothetical protein
VAIVATALRCGALLPLVAVNFLNAIAEPVYDGLAIIITHIFGKKSGVSADYVVSQKLQLNLFRQGTSLSFPPSSSADLFIGEKG